MSNDITAAESLIQIISQSRQNALKKVNQELINMYWHVGEYLSTASAKASLKVDEEQLEALKERQSASLAALKESQKAQLDAQKEPDEEALSQLKRSQSS